MIRFRMLGTLDLRDPQGREVRSLLRSPKLLALLGYLAIARPPGFHRRDTLLALLWPELDHAHARNALRQAVHSLREALGQDVVRGRGEEELGIDQERLWCDVRALEAGEAEQSLELYQGTLLSGLHVSGVPEFERWLDEEREHVRRRACEAAQRLTDREDAAGNPAGAARWARRLTELSPSDETAVRRLIQLLDRSGDRSGAVRAYEEFERRLARDLELEPSSGTQTLVRAVRAPQQPESVAAGGPTETATQGESTAAADATHPGRQRDVAIRPGWLARQRVAAMLALVVSGLLTGGWFVFGGEFGARSAETALTTKRLVVLPFANLGTAEDAYFAAGVTEELTARLASVDRLRVIGSTSANGYKGTNKSIPEIGKELGVHYVLEGSVRWQKSAEGQVRVRVTPQLVSTKDGIHLWAQIYDEPLDQIFRVQSDIAQKVVQALDITLLEQQRRMVEAAPTRNLEAYDHYLRGRDYMQRGTGETALRAASQMFEKAVELDTGFALAYALLGRVHTLMNWSYFDQSAERLAKAKRAIDKALELEPGLAQAHFALGTYYGLGRLDYDQAQREFAIAEMERPNDSRFLQGRATMLTRQGRFRESLADFEKAWQLDPASSGLASIYGITNDIVRDYPRAEALHDRAIALAPDRPNPYMLKTWLYLRWDGNTTRARTVLTQARAAGVADEPHIRYPQVMTEIYDRRYEEAIGLLSSAAPEIVFSGQDRFVPRAQLYAQVYGLMGRLDLARAYWDSARVFLSPKVQAKPDDPRLRSALGIAYAGLGRKPEAIREGLKAVEIMPIQKEAFKGYHHIWELARIYIMVGEYDLAVDRLAYLLSVPGQLTVAWLRMDPVFDPLRNHPRFQRLVGRSK